MTPTPQTIQQIERAIRKVIAKFPKEKDPVLTDIHLQVIPYTGELLTFDDDDNELNRCVVEQWIHHSASEEFYADATSVLAQCISSLHTEVEEMSVLHPFSFVLVDEEHETLSDIYLVDDEQLIVSGELLAGLDEDLNQFLEHLMQ